VVIGDVVGHGLGAATLMGQLRTALHAYALDDNGPGQTLDLLNRFVANLPEDAMATVAYAVIDAASGRIRYSSAGHLPPVFISAEGEARVQELSVAPPVGAFPHQGKPCPEHELHLGPGETMVLFTDGLIERPEVPLPASIDELVKAVWGARTPEDACLLTMDRLVPQRGPRDDAAVLAVQNDPIPDRLELELPAEPRTLARVRQSLTRWLHGQDVASHVAAEITIAVSEACANSVEHAYGPGGGSLTIEAERHNGTVQIAIRDRGSWRPARGDDRGRGLNIMRAAMDDLDIRATPQGSQILMKRSVT
jgi:anti-sigma regulatory factor (Ser/Thr protein kinase)